MAKTLKRRISEQKKAAEKAMQDYRDAESDPNFTSQEKAKLHTAAVIEFDKLRALEHEQKAEQDKANAPALASIGKFVISDTLKTQFAEDHLKKLSPYFEQAARHFPGITCEVVTFADREDEVSVVMDAQHFGRQKRIIPKG